MSSSEGSNWRFWAVVGTTSIVAAAGIGYLVYSYCSSEEDEEPTAAPPPRKPDETSLKLRMARGVQMQSMLVPSKAKRTAKPALPVRKPGAKKDAEAKTAAPSSTTTKTAEANGSTSSTGSASSSTSASGRKTCGLCSKPTTGLPLRCSGCKQVYYCSQDCQRKAWPEHKATCKASKSTSGKAGGSSGGGATADTTSPTNQDSTSAPTTDSSHSMEITEITSSQSASTSDQQKEAEEEPKTFQDALAMYLQQQASSNADQLESNFEIAVMLFVKGEYRAALAKLETVKSMAQERKQAAIEGDVHKWVGHCHNRLGEADKAEAAFRAGAEFAAQHDLPRLEIDCIGGLGCMFRAQNQAQKAVALLEQALALCEAAKDEDSRASTLCNLGSALMQTEPQRGIDCLEQAVALREAAVEKLHAAGERSGLATAVMEHANALVNLASALLVVKKLPESEACFIRALEVFELVEDVDKVVKVLVNLTNMKEVQVGGSAAWEAASQYRTKLLTFLEGHGLRRVDTECSICMEPINMKAATQSGDQALLMLSCLHCLHNKCFEKWMTQQEEQGAAGPTCPTCKQPVPVFAAE